MNSDQLAQKAMDRLAKVGFEKLDESDRVLASVWLFEAGVSNQGLVGYYSGKKSDLAFFVPVALRRISANELATIAEEANAVFGPDGPDRDHDMRSQQVHALNPATREQLAALERRYFNCEEDTDKLLERYLSAPLP